MSENQIFCPVCGVKTDHSTIKSGKEKLVRCTGCGEVQTLQKERERVGDVKVIVSKGGISMPYRIRLPLNEELHVGDDLLVDDERQDVVMTKITSIETDRRVDAAKAGEIKTVWARAIDNITVKVAVFKGGKTQSLKLPLPGDEIFELGEVRDIDRVKFKVTKIKLRGEGFADRAEAKDILRVWGREL
ncbi:MAG: HVO_0476 family zinc finger protein [Methanotrichaceae archaeon]